MSNITNFTMMFENTAMMMRPLHYEGILSGGFERYMHVNPEKMSEGGTPQPECEYSLSMMISEDGTLITFIITPGQHGAELDEDDYYIAELNLSYLPNKEWTEYYKLKHGSSMFMDTHSSEERMRELHNELTEAAIENLHEIGLEIQNEDYSKNMFRYLISCFADAKYAAQNPHNRQGPRPGF